MNKKVNVLVKQYLNHKKRAITQNKRLNMLINQYLVSSKQAICCFFLDSGKQTVLRCVLQSVLIAVQHHIHQHFIIFPAALYHNTAPSQPFLTYFFPRHAYFTTNSIYFHLSDNNLQLFLKLELFEQMKYPQKDIPFRHNYDEDSEDESMFHVASPRPESPSVCQSYRRQRLIGKHNSWKNEENQQYIEFLKENFDIFSRGANTVRENRIYQMMSSVIKSKNYAQCRIHHYRMINRFKSVERVIQQIERMLRNPLGTFQKMEQYPGLKVDIDDDLQSLAEVKMDDLWSVLDLKQQDTEQSDSSL